MSDTAVTASEERGEASLLSWEDLGRQPAWKAFCGTLKELMLRPAGFFDRMATSGGLREPLMFFWILLAAGVLLSFPLWLAYFGLTAPDPTEVSTELYNRHLFAPRAAGFVSVMLPVVLVVAGAAQVLAGSLFHLGARLFGARNWEGSVSLWCYAQSAGAAPLVLAEAAGCVLCVACYLLALGWPEARGGLAEFARGGVWLLGAAGAACGAGWFFVTLITGCTRAWRLDAGTGAAAALAGLLAAGVPTALPVLSLLLWGARGRLASAVLSLVVVVFLASASAAARRSAGEKPPA